MGVRRFAEVRFRVLDAQGGAIQETDWIPNALMNEGERTVLDSFLRNQNNPTTFYVRLFAKAASLTDSLKSMSDGGEPGGLAGYAPQQIERSTVGWPTLNNDGLNMAALSKVVTFGPATSTWPTVQTAVLSTSSDNTGFLIDATTLSQTRQLLSGQTLQAQFKVRQV